VYALTTATTEAEECQAKEREQANNAPNNAAHDSSKIGSGKGDIRLRSIAVISKPHFFEVGDKELAEPVSLPDDVLDGSAVTPDD